MRQVHTGFGRLHPFVNAFFFAIVLLTAMFAAHPAILVAGLLLSASYAQRCAGGKFWRQLLLTLPLMLFTALINPLVSHQGVTVLFRFPSSNACTLESVLYGAASGVRLGTVLFWFLCWNAVMTSDKFVYLFGRVIPSLALTISMGLRFVPYLLHRTRQVWQAQQCLLPSRRGLLPRIRAAGRVLSIVVTWALENALDTADSMKSRGYGLPKRSAFSLYHFTVQDAVALAILALMGGGVLTGALTGGLAWQFYPAISGAQGIAPCLWTAVYVILAAFPLFFEAKEALQWRASQSSI